MPEARTLGPPLSIPEGGVIKGGVEKLSSGLGKTWQNPWNLPRLEQLLTP